MSRKINVIFDVSGSFSADGKDALQINMLITLISATSKTEYSNKEIEIAFLEWGEEIYDISPEDVFENYVENCMKFGGVANIDKLIDFIKAVEPQSRLLLLSDGLFSEGDIQAVKKIIQAKDDILVAVGVGADSDKNSLAQITWPLIRCYSPENVLTALHEICFRSYEANNNLNNINNIHRRVRR